MTHQPEGPARIVEHDAAGHRYVLRVGQDEAGTLTYALRDGAVVLEHTVVDPSRREKGLGSQLVRFALDDVRASGRRVVPQCPFVRAYLDRHPVDADLAM
ncbi:conserved hypothetical protein [Cellulomonas flavigena DSM 20109]|uniref:Uncharacterized protein n=1 Tax=Cellulomonas flavigena (strain ATCC 482 / DSM 20109 / BCRC 11376 / JCM 18109 / NBRC 3775 / NCIMB 8073 / NRS 134) TaxID=446466 RepID=D5UDG9_CELFN|nr:GNAT family N-acetyltransferase [Cellulomonas flavigena]ADG76425.1 conserved hypothetical protein [Cellulomonas flavigena DSM 20109]